MRVTKEDFENCVDSLDADNFLCMIPHGKIYILNHVCTESRIEATFEAFKETECYQCDDCREHFTSADDLNDVDLCADCAYEETTREKVMAEINEGACGI